jgi:hypothetical protein
MFKIVTSDRHDSHGVFVHAKPYFTFGAHGWRMYRGTIHGCLIQLSIGPGAGYQSRRKLFGVAFRGVTAFLGFRVKGGSSKYLYARSNGFRAGITANANSVPYHFGGD